MKKYLFTNLYLTFSVFILYNINNTNNIIFIYIVTNFFFLASLEPSFPPDVVICVSKV